MRHSVALALSILIAALPGGAALAQSSKQVKVVLDFQQQGRDSARACRAEAASSSRRSAGSRAFAAGAASESRT